MTLASSGTMSIGGSTATRSINLELGLSATANSSIGQSNFRTLAGVSSGAISLSNFYGKSNRVALSYTFSANTQNASLNVTSISGYIAGKSDITVTVNSGIYLWSSSTGTPGFTLSGGSSGDTVTLVNNGYIMGQGGNGGGGAGGAGSSGGTALSIGFATTINNTNASAYIGGGGGGGASGSFGSNPAYGGGGGGAGGGSGGSGSGNSYSGSGGGGGSIGSSGGSGGSNSSNYGGGGGGGAGGGGGGANSGGSSKAPQYFGAGGGGGGRIFPGSGGAGGSGIGGAGAGGSSNNAGSAGTNAGSGGGGWGASGANSNRARGGSGGRAVLLNGNSVTWVSGNTTRVYGSVS